MKQVKTQELYLQLLKRNNHNSSAIRSHFKHAQKRYGNRTSVAQLQCEWKNQEEARMRQQGRNGGGFGQRKEWSEDQLAKLNCSSTTKEESFRASPDVAYRKSQIKACLDWVRSARRQKLSGESLEKRRTQLVIHFKAEPIRVPLHLKNLTLFEQIHHKGHYLKKRKYSNKFSLRNLPRILIDKTAASLYQNIIQNP